MQERGAAMTDDHILAQPRNCSMDPIEHLVSGMRRMVAGTEQATMSHSNDRSRGQGSANRRSGDAGVESVADSHGATGSQRGDRGTGVRRGHSRTPWHSAATPCRPHPQDAMRDRRRVFRSADINAGQMVAVSTNAGYTAALQPAFDGSATLLPAFGRVDQAGVSPAAGAEHLERDEIRLSGHPQRSYPGSPRPRSRHPRAETS